MDKWTDKISTYRLDPQKGSSKKHQIFYPLFKLRLTIFDFCMWIHAWGFRHAHVSAYSRICACIRMYPHVATCTRPSLIHMAFHGCKLRNSCKSGCLPALGMYQTRINTRAEEANKSIYLFCQLCRCWIGAGRKQDGTHIICTLAPGEWQCGDNKRIAFTFSDMSEMSTFSLHGHPER